MICGIDEAGRGPLAGPVCAAAVILPDDFPTSFLNDSKKLSAPRRGDARRVICERAIAWGVGWASHTEIDAVNILQASLLAMKRAFEEMSKKAAFPLPADLSVIVDGIYVPDISASCKALVKADAKVHEVMAASILAKTARDGFMGYMAQLYPQYCYEKHKGYPTKTHSELVIKYGPSPIQRKSFRIPHPSSS
jgi:ribonuclease HII